MASTSDSNKSGTLLDELRKNYEVSSRKGRMPKASFVIDFNEPVDNFTEELPGQGTVFRAFRHTERDPASRDLPPPTPKFAHESFLEAQNPSDPMAFHPPKLASKPEKTSGMSLMSSTVPTDAEIVGVTGLGHYVYTCWAKELGCVLRPDLLWFTICNEFAREVRLFPELYRSLLTDKPEGSAKEQLVVLVDTPEQLPMDELDALLESKIPTKELHDLIVKKKFGEFPQEEEFIEAMKITFANSCTPFYDFCTTLCGIPFVQIDGGEVDWKTLSSAIQDLDRILRPSCSAFADYLSKCAKIVDEIIRLGFVQPREALASGDQSQIAKAQKDAETFFSMMFWITSLCGSGHSYNCRGWVLDFYHRSMTAEKRIEYYKAKSKSNSKSKEEYWNLPIEVLPDLPSHVAFIPWRFLPTNRKFVKTTGIFYAVKSADKKFLVPQYGSNTYEIFDDAIFNKLAMTQSK